MDRQPYVFKGLRVGGAAAGLCHVFVARDRQRGAADEQHLVVSAFAEAAALGALDDPDYSRFIVEDTARERARIIAGFKELGCKPMDSVTNFVSADVGRPGVEMVAKMRERGIRIARWSYPDYANYIRVSMGSSEDTDAFLETLAGLLN
jgi:histidinol-phosphate aminotransferase